TLAAVCSTGPVKLFDPKERELRASLGEKKFKYREYAFVTGGDWLVACTDAAVDLWHVPTKTRKKRVLDEGFKTEPYFTGLAGSPTEPLFAACHGRPPDSVGRLSDLHTGDEKRTLGSDARPYFSSRASSPHGARRAAGLG